MTKLTRFFGTIVLVVSLFSAALAGDTLTPPVAPPLPADCTSNCLETAPQPAPDSNDDIVTAVDLFGAWLVASIQ